MLDKLKARYLKAKAAYYNSDPIINDAQFDALEDRIKALDPKWGELKKTGVKVKNKKTEVDLLHPMPSLQKCYPEKIGAWLEKQTDKFMTVMSKLDGSSIQLVYENGKPQRMITRGDGVRGGDISFLIPHVNIRKTISGTKKVILRVEAVMSAAKFKKWATEFDNPRNMVSGLLNRREPHPALQDIDFVVLAVIGDTPYYGLRQADVWGFKTVQRVSTKTDGFDASALLARFKKSSPYAIDGMVLVPYSQRIFYKDADKPRWTTAYKENLAVEDAVTATVKDIIYQTSASKRIIPKVKLVPLKVGDVMVTHATLHNAQWMIDRKIGPGAQVKIVRSGEVIPKIIDVVKPAKIKLPDVKYEKRGVHFVALTESTETRIRQLMKFFDKLGIEFIKSGTITSLYECGYKTPFDYMNLVAHGDAELLKKTGIGGVMSVKLFKELDRVLGAPIELKALMLASNCFDSGMGERKLQAIDDELGASFLHNLVKQTDIRDSKDELLTVPLWQNKTVDLFLDGLCAFVPWLRKAQKFITVAEPVKAKKKKVVQGSLSGQRVSFTGYRDVSQEAVVEAAGGEVIAFGSKTTILLFKADGKTSGKISKARTAGARVTTFEQLGV